MGYDISPSDGENQLESQGKCFDPVTRLPLGSKPFLQRPRYKGRLERLLIGSNDDDLNRQFYVENPNNARIAFGTAHMTDGNCPESALSRACRWTFQGFRPENDGNKLIIQLFCRSMPKVFLLSQDGPLDRDLLLRVVAHQKPSTVSDG